ENLLVRRLQSYFSGRMQVPADMLDREYQLKETQVALSFARIDLKALAGNAAPSAAEVNAFLASAPADSLKTYYDSHLRDFTTPAAVDLRQIRVGIPFQAAAEKKAQAKAAIEKVAQEANAQNFEALATKHSDDEYAKKGGNAGWVNRGSLEPALETAINKLQPGQVSPVVETPFGFFLLMVKAQRPETVKPMDTVKPKIAEAVLKEKRATEVAAKKRTEWEGKLAAGKNIDADLKAAGIEVKKTGAFSLGQGFIPQIGQSEEVLDAVFALSSAKPVAPKLVASGNDVLYIRLDSVTGPKAADEKANRTSVVAATETALESALLTKWIEDIKESASIRIVQKFE
ncbi:peptidyl-prolyl cis-trans isomerase, partial [bacterium]|nr:peptidyl-prolyl cis-trans isomerase [bacterium]